MTRTQERKQQAKLLGDEMRAQHARTLAREKQTEMMANGADLAARDWYRQTCRDLRTRWLYWRPAKAGEAMTLPLIGTEAPNEEWKQDAEIRPSLSTSQVRTLIMQRWNVLPILGKPIA